MKVKSTKKRFGRYATLLSCMVLVGVLLLNIAATLLSDHFHLRLDLTDSHAYSMTDEGKKIAQSVEKEVDIFVLADESDFINGGHGSLDPYYSQANTMIHMICEQSDLFTLKYVDMDKNPSFRAAYPNYELANMDVLVQCGEKVVHIPSIDLFNTVANTMGSVSISSSRAEEAVLSAMLVVTAERLPIISVLQGHEEFTCDPLSQLLMTNAYEVQTENIATADTIGENSEMLVICGPKTDYTTQELDKLEAFLYNDGNYGKTLLYFADTEQPPLPNLEGFLKEWGIEIKRGTVFETNTTRIISSNVFWSLCDFELNDFTKPITDTSTAFPTLPYCRPLAPAYAESGIRKVSSLVKFTSGSGIYPEGIPGWQPQKDDIIGNLDGMMISQAKPAGNNDIVPSNVVVCGTVNFINEDVFKEPSYANAEFIVELTNQLVKSDDSLSLTAKRIGSEYLSITQQQKNTTFVLFVVITPLTMAAMGIWTFLRRRHL